MLKILMVFSFQILFFELFGFLSSYSCVWSSADIFLVRLKLLVVYIREEGFQFFGGIFLAEHLQATASVNFSCTSNAIAFFFSFFFILYNACVFKKWSRQFEQNFAPTLCFQKNLHARRQNK